MMENDGPEGHLLVAGVSFSDVEATISFAQLILERLPVTPAGLLVETRIEGLATGAGHKIVSADGVLRDMPSGVQSHQITKGEAHALKRLIAQLAAERSTHWSCEVAEGDLVACACAASAERDILLLCQRPMLDFRGNVLLLGAAKSHSAMVVGLAQELAKATATAIFELDTPEGTEEEEIFHLVDRSRAAAIVVDLNVSPLISEEGLRRLVSAARCPVVVIGANRIRRQGSHASGV